MLLSVIEAEERKRAKHTGLSITYCLFRLLLKYLGLLVVTLYAVFFRELWKRIVTVSGEPRATEFLMQRLSVAAVRRGNAACVLGTVGLSVDLEDIFHF
jgi:hypothetical protein